MAKKEVCIMSKKNSRPPKPYAEMSLWQVIRVYLISKLPKQKEKIADQPVVAQPKIPEEDINYIAIVLDGVVEDVMRSQNRLAALLLSNPQFIEFNPKDDRPQIGETRYEDGKFVYPENQLMTDEEISETIEKMAGNKDENSK